MTSISTVRLAVFLMAVSWKYRRQTLLAERLKISPTPQSAAALWLGDTIMCLVVASRIRSKAEWRGAEVRVDTVLLRSISDRTSPGKRSNCGSGWDPTRLELAAVGTSTGFPLPMDLAQRSPISLPAFL